MSPRIAFYVAAATALVSAGCASQGPRPDAEITRARTLIEQAERGGAQRYASLEVQQARDKLQRADQAMQKGENEQARNQANEAAADAELAIARASSGEAQRSAQEVQKSIEDLRNEAAQSSQSAPSPQP
ncbi:MAG: DUF4398 domain-containing protein [Steroidobacteraceae bacterium]|nr:DUF4398 domain-containing protein [Steroidobacteraceae bacterium]